MRVTRKRTKAKKLESRELRIEVGRNVYSRMLVCYPAPKFPHDTARYIALGAEAGISKSTAKRIVDGEQGVSLDILGRLATALSIEAYQLLVPRLDPHSPQTVWEGTDAQRAFVAALGLPEPVAKK